MLYDQYFIDDLKDRADLVRSFILLAVIVVVLVSTCLGQKPTKPVLVDELGRIPCEFLLAKTDAFAAELMGEPDARGFIVVHPAVVFTATVSRQLRLISTTLQLRGLELNRFSFHKGKPSGGDDFLIQLWKVPPGAEPPFADTLLWREEAEDTSRAFIFGYADEIGICPTFVPKAFAKLILDRPGSRGHIVIQVANDAMIDKFHFAEEWIRELVEKQGVPRKRLRLFFVKGKGPTAAEFWFVPARTK